MSKRAFTVFLALLLGVWALGLFSQGPGQPTGTVVPKKKTAEEQKPASETAGPKQDVGSTVVVKRGDKPPQKVKKPTGPQTPDGGQPFSIAVSVDLVSIDAIVVDNRGMFIPGLQKGNFRVLEDGVPQQLQTFDAGESPMTVVLLVEFSNRFQRFWSEMWYQTLTASYGFVQTLRKEDWCAIVAYDMRPEILMDFTQNKDAAQGALGRLQFPAFSESNLFDALDYTLDRLKDVAGKKGIVLVATGMDTFSKITYDKAMKRVKEGETPIYPISIGQVVREMADARGYMSAISRMDFLQADNALKTFANDSGGKAFFPRFYGEFGGIFQEISAMMRNQYTLGYVPTNTAKDGKYRKLKVELIGPDGTPLKVVDQKGKEVKYKVMTKPGYSAPKGEQIVN